MPERRYFRNYTHTHKKSVSPYTELYVRQPACQALEKLSQECLSVPVAQGTHRSVWVWVWVLVEWFKAVPYMKIIIRKNSERNVEGALASEELHLIFNFCLH